jgi:hypothetical protein
MEMEAEMPEMILFAIDLSPILHLDALLLSLKAAISSIEASASAASPCRVEGVRGWPTGCPLDNNSDSLNGRGAV